MKSIVSNEEAQRIAAEVREVVARAYVDAQRTTAALNLRAKEVAEFYLREREEQRAREWQQFWEDLCRNVFFWNTSLLFV